MRAQEFITERRDRMYQYIRSIVPAWPEYIVKDWLYANQAKPFGRQSNITPADRSFETLRAFIPELLADIGLNVDTKWQLVPNMKFTMDMWEPKTKQRLIARAGGKPTELVPSTMAPNMKDAERHATQAALAKQQGGIRKEPVILIKTPQGYELLEGWHRTIQHFARYPDGYTGPAYVAVAQGRSGVTENMDHSQDDRAVEELRAALLAKRDQLQSASDDQVYDMIDKIMTRIARSHSISGEKLHDMWVDKYKQIPDTWIMNEQTTVTEAVYRGDWVRHPDNPWQIGQIQNIDNDQALVTWKKTDKRKRAQSSTHPVNDLQHARREFSQLTQPTHSKPGVAENFADGKGPGRPGDSQRHGIPKKATMAELEKASHAKGRKGQLARWQLNMRRGRKKTNEVTVGVLNLGEFAINVDDHAFERAQQRKINLADIDTVLRKIKLPRVIKKIMDIDVGNRFYVLDHVTDVALGFRRIGDKKLVLKTVYPGRPMDLNIAGIITV